ncbi:MAG: putative hydro-lyase [Rhodospirillales bacterium]
MSGRDNQARAGVSPLRPSDRAETGAAARRLIRTCAHSGQTAGMAPGYVQGNVVILPAGLAADFANYCQRNPKPCPLLAASEPGDPGLPTLAEDLDIRTDVPRYRVFRNGEAVEEPTDITSLWQSDFVAFVLGCSFTFEEALLGDGVPLRHIAAGTGVPMYRTNIDTVPAGPFSGKMVVSMRPFRAADAIRAIQITSRFPLAHGAPVHIGDPGLIGIADVDHPDEGDRVEVRDDEIPVFWACGVTPQVTVEQARPPICITHAPGCMVITDLPSSRLAVL